MRRILLANIYTGVEFMGTVQGQVWRGSNFTIGQTPSGAPGTMIFRFSGPFTARDMYNSLTPADLKNLFEPWAKEQVEVHIFDLTEVPYMDSMGLGFIVTHFVRCKDRGVRLVLAGATPRVLQLLQLTKTDNLFPIATIEEVNRRHLG
jgi:anti-anti-sigma factor